MIDVRDYIVNCFDNAVKKGFFTCPDCGGAGKYHQKNPDCTHCESWDICGIDSKNECLVSSTCVTCNGSIHYVNVPDLLMHTLGEFSEVREAYRGTIRANMSLYIDKGPKYFERYIKGTPEEELADSFIILFSLLGYLQVHLLKDTSYIDKVNAMFPFSFLIEEPDPSFNKEPLGSYLLDITYLLLNGYYRGTLVESIIKTFENLLHLCYKLNVSIFPFIDAKMLYNINRPPFNGKVF